MSRSPKSLDNYTGVELQAVDKKFERNSGQRERANVEFQFELRGGSKLTKRKLESEIRKHIEDTVDKLKRQEYVNQKVLEVKLSARDDKVEDVIVVI